MSPLGYPQVIERIAALVEKLPGASLVVDATGVGRAVLDHMANLEPVARHHHWRASHQL